MTGNQIAYHNAIETERWHKATEAENKRHNMTTESIQQRANELQESAIATSKKLADETVRHNVINEQLTGAYNAAMISKSLADSAASYANAALLYEKVNTESVQQRVLISQAALNSANIGLTYARIPNIKAGTELTVAQTKTERMKPTLNTIDTVSKGITAIGSLGVNIGRIIGINK